MLVLVLSLTAATAEPVVYIPHGLTDPDTSLFVMPENGSEYVLPDLLFHRLESKRRGLVA